MRELGILWEGMKFLTIVALASIGVGSAVWTVLFLLRHHPMVIFSIIAGVLFLVLSYFFGLMVSE